jgi:hypothetical protein
MTYGLWSSFHQVQGPIRKEKGQSAILIELRWTAGWFQLNSGASLENRPTEGVSLDIDRQIWTNGPDHNAINPNGYAITAARSHTDGSD